MSIALALRARGLTQQQIARQLGVPRRTVADWLGQFGTAAEMATPAEPLLDQAALDEAAAAERHACEIRLRAERRAGQLLRETEKARGAREPGTDRGATPSTDTRASTLRDFGISKGQSSRWQQLAAVPEGDFEAALAG